MKNPNDCPSEWPEQKKVQRRRMTVEVRRYRKAEGWLTRYWAVYVNGELLAVVLYRKGAAAIAEALVQTRHRYKKTQSQTDA